MTAPLAVIPTGTANLASVLAAFDRLDLAPVVARDAADVAAAERIVLPGVGSFGAAIAEVDRVGMREAIRRRLVEGRPTLAICVGMQLLFGSSEESTGAEGLGFTGERLRRFPDTVRVPQLGWNRVIAGPGCRFVTDGWAYFANSYRVETVPPGWSAAFTEHGGRFVSAMERGDVLACQFHPELSGDWGRGVLDKWINGGVG